jgi:Lsr2
VGLAAAVAGDGIVGLGAADIVEQCVNASPLGEIVIDLVPVRRGGGIRTVARWSTAAGGMDRSLLFGIAGEWPVGGVALQNCVMAKTSLVVLTCDLHGDGTEAVTTIRMDNGTARYELDLCQSHFDELTGAGRRLRPRRRTGGAGAATKAPNRTTAAKTGRRGRGGLDTAAVREWAREHGYTVSDRGRIPRHIVEAFTASE